MIMNRSKVDGWNDDWGGGGDEELRVVRDAAKGVAGLQIPGCLPLQSRLCTSLAQSRQVRYPLSQNDS